MPRLPAALVWLALVSAACRPAHAPTARRIGMVTSIAGVLGLMATAALQRYTTKTDDMLSGFSILSGGGILVFAAGELSEPAQPRRETETEKFGRWARILTSRAAGAAREGRCPRVRRLEKRVNVYDREVHDFVFMRDAAILKCLGGAPPGLEPGAAEAPHLPDPGVLAGADPSAPPGADPGAPPSADPANPPPTLPPPTLPPPPRDPPDLRLPPGTVIPPTP